MAERDAKAPPITPCLWFNGQAEEAAEFYVSLFPGSAITQVSRYGEGQPFPAGTALMVEFSLGGRSYQALNGGPHYTHSEAFSLSISAPDQAATDVFWTALTSNGGSEGRCGWCKDRFGISWQVVPAGLGALLGDPDRARAGRAMQTMMTMAKLDIDAMRAAADGGADGAA